MDHADLERRTGWQLRHLPAPLAPATLLPRVMAAVHAWAARPWYQRAWSTWPAGWQVAAFALLVSAGVAVWLAVPVAFAVLHASVSSLAGPASQRLSELGSRLDVISLAAPVLWRALVYRVILIAFVIVALMSAACATVAVVLNRAVFGRALES